MTKKTTCKQNQTSQKKNFDFKLIDEKAAIVFMIMNERGDISLRAFCSIWREMWKDDFRIENSSKSEIQYANINSRGNVTQKYLGEYLLEIFNDAKQKLSSLSFEEISDIRHGFRDARIPKQTDELLELAHKKGLEISVSNRPTLLSGYKIVLLDKKNKYIQGVNFDLTYQEAKTYLSSVEPIGEIKKGENIIIEALKNDDKTKQLQLVNSYKASYTTHKFDVDINNLLFRRKKPLDYDVIMAVTNMCIKLHIENTTNGKAIRLLKKESYDKKIKKGKYHNTNKSKSKQSPSNTISSN